MEKKESKKIPTVQELTKMFNTEKKALEFIIKHFYPCGKIVCPHCGCSEIIYDKKVLSVYSCGHCRNAILPLNGTMFENMQAHYREWIYILYSMFTSRKSVSGIQLSRETHYTKTGLYKLRRRIQTAMANYDLEPFSGVVQVDECFVASANHGRYKRSGEQKSLKYPVIGIYEQNGKRVYSYPIIPDDKGKYLTNAALKSFIEKTCKEGSLIVSDDWRGYNFLHHKDSNQLYSNSKGFTTNAIEGYWSIIKKTYYSTHANFSKKWAHLYLAEADFRYNHPDWEDAIETVLKQGVYFPQVIDIRNMGRFASKTYDLKDYRMILPKCFDDIDIKNITAVDIVTCDEPVYGILRNPYVSRKKQNVDYPDDWKALGLVEGGTDYKDYRKRITNTLDDVTNMLKDATKHKEVNTYNRIPNESKHSTSLENTRKYRIRKKYGDMPPVVQFQIKEEFPNMFRITKKEKTKEIHKRMNQLFKLYNEYNTA